ncbi:CRISPR-associated autoregulator, Cst2 family [Marinactinospora thermotolerans DSM 45154]|uniref:CRISPR-associated autoregulator, Cst2 family n=1 Tax=Marinactinospora thermotolerans DSM 45154 TaxID=1122192 RepID=A0A1T4S4A8_9ACTN|nr:type I-B CRISPR-associated protein Cas7/Cst2/DevR [Marinactinospora thermotolerans]SKA23119.1 CRISPR-associated autoregulator, Cst2 family [Marinactinospora thermotolerans DSM 45154]
MSYLAGKIVLAVEAGAPNNAKGESTTTPVKSARIRGRIHPYVSAQAFRRWVRDTMTAAGSVPSTVERVGKTQGKAQKATTAADPVRYTDDDLFGYMRATAKSKEEATTLRDSPFMVGTFMSVEPVRVTEDFGVMSRGIDEPVLHSHQFYTADLAAPFLLDLPRVGTFTLPGDNGGKANYLKEEDALKAAAAIGAGATMIPFRGHQALRLPLEIRRDRVAVLLEAIAELAGGAKKALHYGDRTPALVALVSMAGGVNPLGFVVTGEEDGGGLSVRGDVLAQELAAWEGQWEAPVRLGWRPGFRDRVRKEFENQAAPLIDEKKVRMEHPRSLLQGLAEEIRAGRHDHWFDDPQR